MIVAFCGHSEYVERKNDEKRILDIFYKVVGDEECEFFLGEYGRFDAFAYSCAKKYKQRNKKAKLVFISPYPLGHKRYSKDELASRFDLVIYPELEHVPNRFAISHRNRWIVDKADVIIAYVNHSYGGAYAMYSYAKRKSKEIYKLYQNDII